MKSDKEITTDNGLYKSSQRSQESTNLDVLFRALVETKVQSLKSDTKKSFILGYKKQEDSSKSSLGKPKTKFLKEAEYDDSNKSSVISIEVKIDNCEEIPTQSSNRLECNTIENHSEAVPNIGRTILQNELDMKMQMGAEQGKIMTSIEDFPTHKTKSKKKSHNHRQIRKKHKITKMSNISKGETSGDVEIHIFDAMDLPQKARLTIIVTAGLLLFMCLLLVGITLKMAPIIDDMVREENEILLNIHNNDKTTSIYNNKTNQQISN